MEIFKVNDKLPNICCKGYNWDILDVVPDPDIIATYWGKCENPYCMDRISNIEHDSIELVTQLNSKIVIYKL